MRWNVCVLCMLYATCVYVCVGGGGAGGAHAHMCMYVSPCIKSPSRVSAQADTLFIGRSTDPWRLPLPFWKLPTARLLI